MSEKLKALIGRLAKRLDWWFLIPCLGKGAELRCAICPYRVAHCCRIGPRAYRDLITKLDI